jgi:hypothetical protein
MNTYSFFETVYWCKDDGPGFHIQENTTLTITAPTVEIAKEIVRKHGFTFERSPHNQADLDACREFWQGKITLDELRERVPAEH